MLCVRVRSFECMSGAGLFSTLLCGSRDVCCWTMWECISVRLCFIVSREVVCGVESRLYV